MCLSMQALWSDAKCQVSCKWWKSDRCDRYFATMVFDIIWYSRHLQLLISVWLQFLTTGRWWKMVEDVSRLNGSAQVAQAPLAHQFRTIICSKDLRLVSCMMPEKHCWKFWNTVESFESYKSSHLLLHMGIHTFFVPKQCASLKQRVLFCLG